MSKSSISGLVSSRSHISLEPERGQGALDGLALRIQDPGLGPDQDPHPQGAVRSSHAANGSPDSRSYAVT